MIIPPPPPLESLPAGTVLLAGLGTSTVLPDFDFETYSEAGFAWDEERRKWGSLPGYGDQNRGLPAVGAAVYTEDPSCEVLSLAYDLKDGRGRRHWKPGDLMPLDLFSHILSGGLLEAWNVGFESWVWDNVCTPRMGWPRLPREQLRCAMAKARAHALPGALGKAGDVLALPIQKDADGGRLLKKFSVPQNPTKAEPGRRRIHPADDPIDAQRLYAYNVQDIAAEAAIAAVTPDLMPEELANWQMDQRINRRGVAIDRDRVRDCIAVLQQAHARYNEELRDITGGAVQAASETERLQAWCAGAGFHIAAMDEDTVTAALAGVPPPPPHIARALEIRQAIGSAAVKKLHAMEHQATRANRLHDLFLFHAARTGRTTGAGPQPTNLPNSGPDVRHCGDAACGKYYGAHHTACPHCGAGAWASSVVEWNPDAVETALEIISYRLLDFCEYVWGAGQAVKVIAACLRGLFVAAPGHELVCSDYSAIEAVGLAALAGEEWRLEVFRTHGKIYEMSAAQITGIPFEEFAAYKKAHGTHHPLRKKVGKVAELACFSPDTQVLTRRGYVAIVDVSATDLLWDGERWVKHGGVVAKGIRPVIDLDGVRMTPTHPIFIGDSWREASALASSANTLSRALAIGSANLPSSLSNSETRAASLESSSNARAGRNRTPPTFPICARGGRPGATVALRKPAGGASNGTGNTPTSLQTTDTEEGYSIESPLASGVAIARPTPGTPTTAAAESRFTNRGGRTAGRSSLTSSPSPGGTDLSSNSTARTLTKDTNPGTSVSLPSERTTRTGGRSGKCNGESTTLSPVYDIVNAGPLHRFTIRTSSGHLIVHNSGYQGWVGAWRAFGAEGTDDEIKRAILNWRAASPNIVEFWGGQFRGRPWDPDYRQEYFGIEGAAVQAVLYPRTWFSYRSIGYYYQGDVLYCRLLSGRLLTYHRPRLAPSTRDAGYSLSYEGYNTNPKNGPVGWIRMNTWGGRLTENIVQATCRDIQWYGMRALEARGYPIVLHVYDEDVAEVPQGSGSVEEFEAIMSTMPPWAADWPIRASGGWRGRRYRK